MKNQIAEAMARLYPELKPYQITRCVDKYVDVMLAAIKASIINFGFADNQVSIPLDEISSAVGRIAIAGKKQSVVTVMHSHASLSLVIIDFKGNIGKNSRISFNPIYQKQIMDELINLKHELNDKRINDLKAIANETKVINLDTLDDYISKTLETFEEKSRIANPDKQAQRYLEALERNLLIAGQLKDMAVLENGVHVVKEYWTELDSGRRYGHGLSLQRIPKHVRHAAMGISHKYDFKASSFALMAGLAHAINPDLKLMDLIEYVRNRSEIRKIIARDIGITENRAKDIFTSLGFGASTANNLYTSIRGNLSEDQYNALMNHYLFKHINKALTVVRNTILEHFSADEFEFMGRKYEAIDPNDVEAKLKDKKRSRNQKLAWIYQVMESDAIQAFGQMATDAGYEPTLYAHDCAYFQTKLATHVLTDIVYNLQITYPYLQVEHEEVVPIFKDANKLKTDSLIEYDEMVEEHKQLMDLEELKARKNQSDGRVAHLDVEFGEFAAKIKALNPGMRKSLGSSFNFGQ